MSSNTVLQQSRDAYDPFAWIYNRNMAEDFFRRAFPIVEELLLKVLPSEARILDLCCGSGQFARELSHRGYRITGLDGSAQMVNLARSNSPEAEFILADARNFSLPPVFDAVICNFNSLAHASTIEELTALLTNARAALNPHGRMLFDLSMEEAYTMRWQGTYGDVNDQVGWLVRVEYDGNSRIAHNHVTLFERDADDRWRRSDFTIDQKCHSEFEVHTALNAAGFSEIHSYDAERDLGMNGEFGRRFFLCS
jgi:SAM-dependent methyltransferase